MTKYLILDFGNVIAHAATGEWFITPCFLSVVNMNVINREELLAAMKEYSHILSRKAVNLEDEYELFKDFYTSVFNRINYSINEEDLKKIVYNMVYEDDKYSFYDNVHEELELLSKKYTLILLSDNWPSVLRIMNNVRIAHYFDKIYVSSIYGYDKKDKVLFDFVINDYGIKNGEAIFVDDNDFLLNIAEEKGLDVRLMNRECKLTTTNHQVINTLLDLL